MTLGPVANDPRFFTGLRLLETGDYLEASDEFEELFFEAVRDERDFVRLFLQISTGMHHIERNQLRAAIERLHVGIETIELIHDARGYDLKAIRVESERVIRAIEQRMRTGERIPIQWTAGSAGTQ